MLHKPLAVAKTDSVLWMVYRQDEHGVRRLVKDTLSEAAAAREIGYFEEAAARKPHKMDYFKVSYTKSTRSDVLARERINE